MSLLIFYVLLAFAGKFEVIQSGVIRGLIVIGLIAYVLEELRRK